MRGNRKVIGGTIHNNEMPDMNYIARVCSLPRKHLSVSIFVLKKLLRNVFKIILEDLSWIGITSRQ